LHRLFVSGSDRAAEVWRENYRIPGTEGLDLHHLYRAMAFLGSPLKDAEMVLGSPRCVKDEIEEILFDRRRDLFTEVDLVFFDTTSIYFEGQGGQSLGHYGHSKDHRRDLKQMIVGIALDAKGWPLCCEMWPGNTTDVKTLLPVAERMKTKFHVRRICIIADRGMIRKKTMQELDTAEPPVLYILGVRMRRQKEVSEKVLTQRGAWQEIHGERKWSKEPAPLKIREVALKERRYIVCLNEEERRKDAHDRQAIIAHLRDQLKQGDKSLVGNKGYRRFLKMEGKGHFVVDEGRIKKEERFDGVWVLRTNTDYSAEKVAMAYKSLWMVEDIIRTTKSILDTRPIYHKCDETIRGHVFCSFLALVLKAELEKRLTEKGEDWEWREVIRGLDNLRELRLMSRSRIENETGMKFRPPPLLVTFHPVTLEAGNTEAQIGELMAALDCAGLPVLFTCPNADMESRTIIRAIKGFVESHPGCCFVKNLGTRRYFSVMKYAVAMVGNSSSGIIEAASFKLPVVNVGNRQGGRVHGRNVVDVPCKQNRIAAAIRQVTRPIFRRRLKGLRNPYGDGRAAVRIALALSQVTLDGRLLTKRFAE